MSLKSLIQVTIILIIIIILGGVYYNYFTNYNKISIESNNEKINKELEPNIEKKLIRKME